MQYKKQISLKVLLLAGLCYSATSLAAEVCLQDNYYTPGSACQITQSGKTLEIKNNSDSDTLQAKKVVGHQYALYAYLDDPTGEGALSCREGKIKRV